LNNRIKKIIIIKEIEPNMKIKKNEDEIARNK
jgi:hypothetical protein